MNSETKQRIVELCEGTEGKKGIGWPELDSEGRSCVRHLKWTKPPLRTSGKAWMPEPKRIEKWYIVVDFPNDAINFPVYNFEEFGESYFEKWLEDKLVEAGCEIKRSSVTVITLIGKRLIAGDKYHLAALLDAADAVLK